jgi:hypothetical protein
MKPLGGAEVGLRRESEEGRIYASFFIQGVGAVPSASALLSKADAKKLSKWLEVFMKDAG